MSHLLKDYLRVLFGGFNDADLRDGASFTIGATWSRYVFAWAHVVINDELAREGSARAEGAS
eukprot:4544459-Pyramimonas_sp.AAC.1